MPGSAPAGGSSTATVEPFVTNSDDDRYQRELRDDVRSALDHGRSPDPGPALDTGPPPGAGAGVIVGGVGVAGSDLPYAEDDDDDDDGGAEEGTKRRHLQNTLEWVAVVVGALVVALVVKTFLFQAFYIPSASMEPTLEQGDRVLVNKVSYDLHDVNRGDVIVFELDDDDVGEDGIKDLIKRVVGLPGEVVESRDGVVYVNDRALEEPYLDEGTVTGDPDDPSNPPIERQTVPEGHVFVLGDNRSNSADSRYPYRGPIPIDTIVGRAFVLVWPPDEIKTL
jgi:signal peptidase I